MNPRGSQTYLQPCTGAGPRPLALRVRVLVPLTRKGACYGKPTKVYNGTFSRAKFGHLDTSKIPHVLPTLAAAGQFVNLEINDSARLRTYRRGRLPCAYRRGVPYAYGRGSGSHNQPPLPNSQKSWTRFFLDTDRIVTHFQDAGPL